jgi:hypothetical protein
MVSRRLSSGFCTSQTGAIQVRLRVTKDGTSSYVIAKLRDEEDALTRPQPLQARHEIRHHRRDLSVDSYHCLVFFAVSCASENTFQIQICETCSGNDRDLGLTFSLSYFEALPKYKCRISRLTTTSRRAKSSEMLRLVNHFG